jgi:uncharacterized protein YqhQ
MKNSGIGGQAVIEGIMMRNKDKYAIAVRKPDNEIEVMVKESTPVSEKHPWLKLPMIRGVVSFVDSLVTGISTLTYSASFYDDPAEQKKTKADEIGKAIFKDKLESVLMAVTVIIAVIVALALFMVLPYFASRIFVKVISSQFLLNLLEGLVRIAIFILYIVLISHMNDIKRTFMYHGAEHKCINCIEHGMSLTADNVMNSSRLHKRCGTSFMFLVMFISIIFFIFIRVDNTGLQVLIRLLLIPVIAGVSYEVLRAAGKNDENKFLDIVSRPGLWMQKLTTKEPDRRMVEVAICAVEAVFDWREFVTEYNKNDENFVLEESAPEDFVTDEEKTEAAMKRKEAYNEVLEQQANDARKAEYDEMAESSEDGSDDDIFTFEDANGRKIDRAEVEEPEDDDSEYSDSDDGIEFDEDTSGEAEDEELYADDVPVFKQRKTDK